METTTVDTQEQQVQDAAYAATDTAEALNAAAPAAVETPVAGSPSTEEPTTDELLEFFGANQDTYTFLSRMFFKELNQEAIDELAAAEWPQDTGNANLDTGYNKLRRYFKFSAGDRRTQLAVEYARIFLAAGVFSSQKRSAVPYESVYTSVEHTMMGDTRDDLINWFIQDGFKVNPDLHEPEDHLSFEYEYLASMNAKAAALAEAGDVRGLRKNLKRQMEFSQKHILNWLPTLRETAESYATSTFYMGMLYVAQGALEQANATAQNLLDRLPHLA